MELHDPGDDDEAGDDAPSLPFDMDAALSHGFGVDAGEDDDSEDDDMPPLMPSYEDWNNKLWLCRVCHSPDFRFVHDGWRCARCGCGQFYDGNVDPTSTGSWVYVPNKSDRSPAFPGESRANRHGAGQKPAGPGDPADGDEGEGKHREYAESETLTNDPSVDTQLKPLSRRKRRAAKRSDALPSADRAQYRDKAPRGPPGPPGPNVPSGPNVPGGPSDPRNSQDPFDPRVPGGSTVPPGPKDPLLHGGKNAAKGDGRRPSDQWRDSMLQNLSNAMTRDKNADWNNKKGPMPGVKYRGGAPPQPPAWTYSRDDLRAFQKWERKLQVWRVQISAYLPPNEAAMMLYVSLRGEAEEELEYCPLDMENNDKGIDYILESLRKPLMTRSIYLKRRYLHEFENVQRQANESIKAYCNRYHRTERSLESIGVNVGLMYDSEARGSRLLDRMRISLEQQRLILIGSGQSLHFDDIKEAAQLQFPDHRPTPMVTFMREFEAKEKSQSSNPNQTGAKGNFFKKGKGKGKDKSGGKGYNNKTYVAENVNETDAVENQDDDGAQEAEDVAASHDQEGYDDEEQPGQQDENDENEAWENEDDEQSNALKDAAECLTVTARRLQGLTLGRKFSGQQSIQDRKKNTHCAICGEKGHWQGDDECQYSNSNSKGQKGQSSGGASNKSKTGKAGSKGKSDGDKSKKVFTVMNHDGSARSVTFQETPEETYGTYFTYMVKSPSETHDISKIYGTNMNELCHFVVLDTACQKSCCSSQWMDHYSQILSNYRLKAKLIDQKEPFEFGHGPTQFSDHHAYLPTCFDGSTSTTCLLGAFIIPNTNDIPFLGSHSLLKKLQMVLDLPNNKARLNSIHCEVDIQLVNGHLALKIDRFSSETCRDSIWKKLSQLCDDPEADVELLIHPKQPELEQELKISNNGISNGIPVSTTAMARSMAKDGEELVQCRAVSGDDHVAGREASSPPSQLASSPGPHGYGMQDGLVGESRRSVQARKDPKVRKQARPICKVPGLPDELEVGRRKGKMGLKDIAKAAISTLAILFNSGSLLGEESSPRLGLGNLEGPHVQQGGGFTYYPWLSTGLEQEANGEIGCDSKAKAIFQEKQQRGPRRVRLVPSGPMNFEKKKKVNSTWLVGHLRAQQKLYDYEVKAYKALATYEKIKKNGGQLDLMEVFSGRGRLTSSAHRYGLNALQPIDAVEGIDLMTFEGQTLTLHALREFKPLLLVTAWPCTQWSIMNENCNYQDRKEELEELREAERPMLRFTTDLCAEQIEGQRLYLGENPARSRLWEEKDIQPLLEHPDTRVTMCHAGAYGAEDAEGYPIIKSHRWITNSVDIAEELQLKMTPEQQMYARPIEGSRTKASGEYCQGLANAILRGLLKEVRKRNPTRFCDKAQVFYARPMRDEAAWSYLLDEIEKRFQNTYKRPFNVAKNDELHKLIVNLVPWRLERVQAAWTPAARRWPEDVPFTHRGAALRTTTGQIVIEDEDLAAAHYPKQRYTQPMRLGIFFFGMAPDDQDQQQEGPGQEPEKKEPSSELLPGFKTEIWFEGGPMDMTKELKSSLARLHVNMGHASREELVRILAASNNLNSKVIAGLDALRCGSCIRLKQPKKPPTSSTAIATKHSGFFGENLESDIVYMRIMTGEAIPVVGILCGFTNYHCAKTLTDRNPETMLKAFKEIWYKPLGLPMSVTVDPDGAYLSAMQEWHSQHGINYIVIPAEEHWRLGKIERRNAILRTICEKMIDEHGVSTRENLEDILAAALFALNSSTYTHGRSPFQCVFGRVPRPIGDLVSDPNSLVVSYNADQHLLQPELLRAEAITNLMQVTSQQAVKRAILRKTKNQTEISSLLPGQPIAFWRWSTRARQHKKGAWCLGRFLALDPDKRSAWIQVGKTSMKVGNGQIRPAAGWESWTPSQDDVQLLKNAERTLAAGLWEDGIEEDPGEKERSTADSQLKRSADEMQNDDYWTLDDQRAVRHHVKPRYELYSPQQDECNFNIHLLAEERQTYMDHLNEDTQPEMDYWRDPENQKTMEQAWTGRTMFWWRPESLQPPNVASLDLQQADNLQDTPVPSLIPQPPQSQQQQMQQSQPQLQLPPEALQQNISATQAANMNIDNRQINIHVESPTYQQFGPNTMYGPTIPTARSRRRSRTPSRQPHTPRQEQGGTAMPIEETNVSESEQRPAIQVDEQAPRDDVLPEPSSLPQLPMKRPAEALMVRWFVNAHGEAEPAALHWDGSEEIDPPFKSKILYNSYLASSAREIEMKSIGDPLREDHSSSDEDLELSNDRTMTRQEAKQLDREIPWREVDSLPVMMRDKYVQSAVSEYEGWMTWGGIKPLSETEAQEVWRNPKLKRRVMRSRAAYRDKNRGSGELKPKTRVVIIGCMDPDLKSLTRDSPTPTRLSEMLILAIATAGANRLFNYDGEVWQLWLSDAEKAFLQGKQDLSERGGQPLFMQPPDDPILRDASAYPAPLYQITGNGYGLANAPRIWYNKVLEKMTENNFYQHTFDRCFFMHRNEDGRLDCALIVHVDDVMATYAESFNLDILKNLFSWGQVTLVDCKTPGQYRGKEITMLEEKGQICYKISQRDFIKHLDEGKLAPGRLQRDHALTEAEMKEFRSVVGCIQWLGGQSRPDVCASASLCHKSKDTSINELKSLYDTLSYLKSSTDDGIVFPAVPLNRSSVIVGMSDSSWANAANFTSQYGTITMICPPQVKDATAYGMLVDWKSGRSTRVCRSTLAAEASAADESTDRACYVNLFVSEILNDKPAYRGAMSLEQLQVVDAKSLYDCLIAENPVTSDKRSMINVRSVQQVVKPSNVHWIPTRLMHCDGLTKLDKQLQNNLREWCKRPWCQLRDDSRNSMSKQRPVWKVDFMRS